MPVSSLLGSSVFLASTRFVKELVLHLVALAFAFEQTQRNELRDDLRPTRLPRLECRCFIKSHNLHPRRRWVGRNIGLAAGCQRMEEEIGVQSETVPCKKCET